MSDLNQQLKEEPSRANSSPGGKSKIAVWSLDTDYDERSLLPRQIS